MLKLSEEAEEEVAMLNELFGTKIGMTQVFDQDRNVIPATVINIADWFITQVKTKKNDGYSAIQVGLLKKRYHDKKFSDEWLSSKEKIFSYLREVEIDESEEGNYLAGQAILLDAVELKENESVAVSGISRGLGFQGVMKRWGFAGGPKGHGSNFHRAPGSIGNMATQGNVVKGKKLPGRCGGKAVTVKGLRIVKVDQESGHVFVSGAVPGKKNSLLFICKQR